MLQHLRSADFSAVTVVLCDADGNLFPSEEPAFEASVSVTNRYLQRLGLPGGYTAEELRIATTGKNFRTTAVDLAVSAGVPIDSALAAGRSHASAASAGNVPAVLTAADLEAWVKTERDEVTAHLATVLRPDSGVVVPLRDLHHHYRLAAVSSSALMRLQACFEATDLDVLLPASVRFSAEDSLPTPTSKPDPAIYRLALDVLGVSADMAVAIEDSVPGVSSAVNAGIATIGNLMFVQPAERAQRYAELAAAGACAITDSWHDIAALLTASSDAPAVAPKGQRVPL
jgi:beta-phosphoglucomutase-like phosphatase (HAD superfamily)